MESTISSYLQGISKVWSLRCEKLVAQTLLAQGANPNVQGFMGSMPQIAAGSNNDTLLVQLSFNHGADPLRHSAGGTAVHTAAMCNHVDILVNVRNH